MIRLSWVQPEDLVAHAVAAARDDGVEVDDLAERWRAAGGSLEPVARGATQQAAPDELRRLGTELLAEIDRRPIPADLAAREPDDFESILAAAASETDGADRGGAVAGERRVDLDRLHGAWLGRAVGCLLGKPVEKVGRAGVEAIGRATGNWPVTGYFTAVGLDPETAAAHPWNRRSAVNSLVENIDGMPEDDDLNFPLIALGLVERHGAEVTTDDVATAWLDNLPGGRVFTAERIAYRNLLAGIEPDRAGSVGNPFGDWIGAQIRTDVYGWVAPDDHRLAARLAWTDARLSHYRNGVYGALFVAAACGAAVRADTVDECLTAGLSVVPAESRYAAAIAFGRDLAASGRPLAECLDELVAAYGPHHWVHVLNNAALVAFALIRSGGDFDTAITTVVTGGWDTDSNGATVGSICGALGGTAAIDRRWTDPLHNRLASSIPGFDGIGFDVLAERTMSAMLTPP